MLQSLSNRRDISGCLFYADYNSKEPVLDSLPPGQTTIASPGDRTHAKEAMD